MYPIANPSAASAPASASLAAGLCPGSVHPPARPAGATAAPRRGGGDAGGMPASHGRHESAAARSPVRAGSQTRIERAGIVSASGLELEVEAVAGHAQQQH